MKETTVFRSELTCGRRYLYGTFEVLSIKRDTAEIKALNTGTGERERVTSLRICEERRDS